MVKTNETNEADEADVHRTFGMTDGWCLIVIFGIIVFCVSYMYLDSNSSKSTQNVSQSTSSKLSGSEADKLKQIAKEMSTNPYDIQATSVRKILSNSKQYLNKRVVIGPMKVFQNNLTSKKLDSMATTIKPDCFVDNDIDASIDVYYDTLKEHNLPAIEISAEKNHIFFADGIVRMNDFGHPVLEAKSIYVTGFSRDIKDL